MTQPPNDQPTEPSPQPVTPNKPAATTARYGPPPPNAPRYQPATAPAPASQPGFEPNHTHYSHPTNGQFQPYPNLAPPVAQGAPQYQPLPQPGPGGVFDGAHNANQLNRPLYGAHLGHAIARFFQNYARFSGRASRSEYWWMVLAFWAAVLIITMLGAGLNDAIYSLPYEVYRSVEGFQTVLRMLLLLLFLGTIVPWLALSWRRLHDANLSGAFYLFSLIPYLGWIPVLIFTLLPPKPQGRRFD